MLKKANIDLTTNTFPKQEFFLSIMASNKAGEDDEGEGWLATIFLIVAPVLCANNMYLQQEQNQLTCAFSDGLLKLRVHLIRRFCGIS